MIMAQVDTFAVVLIRGGSVPGELVHTGHVFSDAYEAATAQIDTAPQDVSEIRMVRTDHWGVASVSGRWSPNRKRPVAVAEAEHTCGPGIQYGCDVPECDGNNGD